MLVNIHFQFKKTATLLAITIGLLTGTKAGAQVWPLSQCIDSAQQLNKQLRIANNNVGISRQKVQEAKSNLVPRLTVNADYRYFIDLPYQFMPQSAFGGPEGQFKQVQFGVPHVINANIQLSMPLYSPQLASAIKTTKIASGIAGLQYEKTEEQIIYEVTNLYYNAQILYHRVAFIDSNLLNATKLLQNMELLKKQLLAKKTDVAKIQLQIGQLTTQRELAYSQYTQVLNALKLAIGLQLDQIFDIEKNIVPSTPVVYNESTPVDIRLASHQNLLLNSELDMLKRSRLPSLSLYGSYGQNGFGYDKAPNDFLKFYPSSFAGVRLAYPLFSGTTTHRQISQKKLELNNNALQLSLMNEQATLQVETAKQQRSVAQRSATTTLEQTKLAQSIYDETLLEQSQGLASLNDVILADNALREAQQQYLSAMVDYLKADLNLKKTTGSLLNKQK